MNILKVHLWLYIVPLVWASLYYETNVEMWTYDLIMWYQVEMNYHTLNKSSALFSTTLRTALVYIARYTLFANNDEKGTNKQNSCEMRILCREWFVRFVSIFQKTFAKCVRQSRWFFDKFKELFSPYFQLLHAFVKTAIYDEYCVDLFSPCFPKLNFFTKK